jgi:hypothetical protein
MQTSAYLALYHQGGSAIPALIDNAVNGKKYGGLILAGLDQAVMTDWPEQQIPRQRQVLSGLTTGWNPLD